MEGIRVLAGKRKIPVVPGRPSVEEGKMQFGALRLLAIAILFLQFFATQIGNAADADYPEKPIRFLVGLTAGSLTDISARAVAKVAAKYLSKPLVVVNSTGASGSIAMGELAKAPPDGHTIALMPSSYQYLTVHMQKVPFDPKVLKTVLGYAQLRYVLFVKADSPYGNFDDLLAHGRKYPWEVKFGHSGRGTGIQVVGVAFFRNAGISATDVPYKGSIGYVNDVLGGNLMAGVVDISGVAQHVRGGKLKLVLAFTDERIREFPDVPTAKEKGFPDLSSLNTLIDIVIHRDTPSERVRILHDALKRAIDDPELHGMLTEMGLQGGYIAPGAVDEATARAERISLPLLKELNLLAE